MNAPAEVLSPNALHDGASEARERFYRWVNASELPEAWSESAAWLAERLAATAPLPTWDGLERDGEGWDLEPAAVFGGARLLAFHAPLGLTEGAWLQHLGRSGLEQSPAMASLFQAYLLLMGDSEAHSPAAAYRARLLQSTCQLAPVPSWNFAEDARVGPPALDFASLQLALGLHWQGYFPEALGFTLAYAQTDVPWRLSTLRPSLREKLLAQLAAAANTARSFYLAGLSEGERGIQDRRMLLGASLYREAALAYGHQLQGEVRREPGKAEIVADIIRRKARYGRGYHGRMMLAGKTLDQWFAQEPLETEAFMAAFAESAYAAGCSGGRVLDKAAGFGGPMFGVFQAEELAAIGAWLDEGARGLEVLPAPAVPRDGETVRRPEPRPGAVETGAGAEPKDPRSLFHHLLRRERFPGAVRVARGRVARTLALAYRSLGTGGVLGERFFDYSPEALAQRMDQIHAAEVARYAPLERPRLRREEVVWGIRQMAPAILVDGCWLRGFGEAADQDERIQRLLLRTHADELGAGRLERNHPAIYRRLLESLGIRLPPVGEEVFARDPEFLDRAFDLPVHLLGISCFPRSFLPEILGLNLAIEMSGLGAGYMQLAAELRHWAIDPLIVELHLSIDNLAAGHAAMAVEAIQRYLEGVRLNGGEVPAHWRRIWCGYLSLGAATRGFKRALQLAFCRRFLPGRMAAWFGQRLGRPPVGGQAV